MVGHQGMYMSLLLKAAAVAVGAMTAVAPAHALVIGTADGQPNSIPFGSAGGGYYFQQVYNAASFGSGINISELSFYNTQAPGGTPRAGSFQIYLSTTAAAINTFDTNTSVPWLDASFTQVFDGTLPALADGRLDFDLSTTFSYDPTMGNLLLTVRSFDFGTGDLFLDVDQNNGVTNSRFSLYPSIGTRGW
jgi:hypothetical protein